MIKSYDPFKMVATMMGRMLCKLIVVVVFVSVSCDVTKRTVTVIPWPDCSQYKVDCAKAEQSGSNVVYAKAFASNDSLLYAFSTIGVPTVVVARVTGHDTDMHFNWEKLVNESTLEDAITINETFSTVVYKFGAAFTRLIEYNDIDDNADINYENKYNASNWIIKDFNLFNWIGEFDKKSGHTFIFNASYVNNNLTDMTLQQEGSSPNRNWSISFSFTVQQDEGRSSELPSLKYGANETQFDFVIANYPPTFSKSRFALESVLVSQSRNKNMEVQTTDSIDDEYSPGVFKMVNWLSYPSQSGGYMQWKPVCYNSKDRARKSATQVKHYDLTGLSNREAMARLLNTSILPSLFSKDLFDENKVIIQTTNISFGLSEDGFYLQNNYTAWSAAIGYGTPPADAISLTVIVIISAGLGLPVILLVLGGVYTCIKKSKKRLLDINASVSRTQSLIN